MTNYTKAVSFTAKDALDPGDPDKIVRGSDFDTEFDAIVTAVASKSNTASPTFTGVVGMPGYTETVFALSTTTPAIDPDNGSIQTWTLTAPSTPTDSLAAGQSVMLLIAGTAHAITWTMVDVWKTIGDLAPDLETTGVTVILLWKVGTTVYGALIGEPA